MMLLKRFSQAAGILTVVLTIMFAQSAAAQSTGEFCFNFQWPTTTVEGSDVSVVGLREVYFEIARPDDSYWDYVRIADETVTSYCFENVPAGPGLMFAHVAYDAIGCQGDMSPITTHEVFELREMVSAPVIDVVITGTQPKTDTEIENNRLIE